jgi:hypothetical protein
MLTTLQTKAKSPKAGAGFKSSFRAKKGRSQSRYRGKEKSTDGVSSVAGFNLENTSFSQIPVYSNQTIQTKLTVNEPGDKHEQEADNIADKVMRMPGDQQIQRKCSACEEEDKKIQRKPGPGGVTPITKGGGEAGVGVSPAIHNRIASSQGGGSSLDGATNSFMSDRFGVDFGSVKIHNNSEAAQLNRQLNARAFTVGRDIYFNSGEYEPGTSSGRHLLAHELAHTVQQGATQKIYRKPAEPAPKADADEAEAVKIEAEILAAPEYGKLDDVSKARVNSIITILKGKPDKRLYYLKKLKDAVTFPFQGGSTGGAVKYACSPELEKENRKAVEAATDKEDKDWKGLFSDVEEKIVDTSKKTDVKTRVGEQNKKFTVDASDVNNIRVRIKVKLNGKTDDVNKIKHLEDAIERSVWMSTRGYMLDIVFVDAPGPDVFEFTVNFCIWPNSGNWASPPITLSHEVHHALGLGDRYDYIESHSKNPDMNPEMRLVWFEKELQKSAPKDLPNNPESKMATSSKALQNDDVCAVAFDPGPERDKCIKDRNDFDKWGF